MALVGRWQESLHILEIMAGASLLGLISFNCALKACGERWDVALALLQQIHQATRHGLRRWSPGEVGAE